LTEAMDDGHCALPTNELVPLAEKLLEIPQDLVRTALDLELAEGTVIADQVGEIDCIFLATLHRAERAIAKRLLTLAKGELPWASIDPDKAIPWIEQRIKLTLAESQKAAVGLALASKVLVITGGPGVGKTTIRQRHPAHSLGQAHTASAVCPHRPRGQADERSYRT
jgi:exodeoxyribonuclease V alpha subunit